MSTLEITPPAEFINANDRLHHAPKARLTKAWREAAAWTATSKKLGYWTKPVHITCTIRFPDNIRRDVGNWYPTAKAIVDGLVDAGVLYDDSDTYVLGPDMRREYPNGPARVTVELREVGDAA